MRSYDPLAWLLGAIGAFALFNRVIEGWTAKIMDPDLWWQIWAGRQLLAGTVPRTNAISWTAPDEPWVSHEPLYAAITAAVGVDHVIWLRVAAVTVQFLLLAWLAWRPRSAFATGFAAVYAASMVYHGTTERALTWGNALIAAVMALVVSDDGRPSSRRLLAATVLVGVGANVHGSFLFGLLALLSVSWRHALAAGALTLLNPYGLGLWKLLAGYGAETGALRLVSQSVPEWGWLDPTDPQQAFRALALVATILLLALRRDRGALLLVLAATALTIRHWRYADIAGIVALPYLARELERRMPARPAPPLPWLLAALLPVLLLLPRGDVDREHFPEAVLPSIPRGHVYNDFDLGGWLGLNGVPVFWDGRNDCYPEAVFADGLAIAWHQPGWREVVDRRGVDVIVSRDAAIVEPLLAAGWVRRAPAPLFVIARPTDLPGQ